MSRHFLVLPLSRQLFRIFKTSLISASLVNSGSGKTPSSSYYFSYLTPSWMSKVASPPSSISMSGPGAFGHVSIRCVQSQYSSIDSFFQAKTFADLAAAMADAAWS
jgi:hypothetical protein